MGGCAQSKQKPRRAGGAPAQSTQSVRTAFEADPSPVAPTGRSNNASCTVVARFTPIVAAGGQRSTVQSPPPTAPHRQTIFLDGVGVLELTWQHPPLVRCSFQSLPCPGEPGGRAPVVFQVVSPGDGRAGTARRLLKYEAVSATHPRQRTPPSWQSQHWLKIPALLSFEAPRFLPQQEATRLLRIIDRVLQEKQPG